MPAQESSDHTTDLWPRCEFGKTPLAEEDCQMHGEVRLDGSLLCVPHAKLLRLHVRENLLLAKVFEMDEWLDGPGTRANQSRWWRVLGRRDEAVELLRSNRKLIEAHREQNP